MERVLQRWRAASYSLIEFAFVVALLSYLGFSLIDYFRPGFVSTHISPRVLLGITIVLGVLLLSVHGDRPVLESVERTTWRGRDALWVFFVANMTGLLVWTRLRHLGTPGIVLSILALVFVAAAAIWMRNTEPKT